MKNFLSKKSCRVGWRGSDGREGQQGRDVCIHIADSLSCTAESNTAVKSNYTPIKINKNEKNE